jgi:putative methyltransferase (TIGR04325 family)
LKIVDFGGSLGSTYFQYRVFFQHLNHFEWTVVEQKKFVECGKQLFEDDHLRFCDSLRGAMKEGMSAAILLSSVLPYVPEPYILLRDILLTGYKFILLDRTPFIAGARDRLTVQKVSGKIYRASYPAWFLSEQKIMDTFLGKYRIALEFQRSDKSNVPANYHAVLFEKNDDIMTVG